MSFLKPLTYIAVFGLAKKFSELLGFCTDLSMKLLYVHKIIFFMCGKIIKCYPSFVLQTVAAAKPTQYTATYQANATGYQTTYAQPAVQTTVAAQPVTQAKRK